jgi:hypothetical protein
MRIKKVKIYFIFFLEEKTSIDNPHPNNSLANDNYNQINSISYKVLHTCNIWKNKNKNNNTKLKSGTGKLMMTNGISISEFAKKYNL